MSETVVLLNVNETALLGLLSEKARYGYELDKIIEERLMREWTDIAFSSIYAVLKGLESKGCVESAAEIAGNRVRRHYSITRKGRKALREAVRKTLSEPVKVADSLMAGVANISLLPDEEARQALETRVAALKAQQTMVAQAAATVRKKDKLYFDCLTARAGSRINEELRFVELLLGEAPLAKPVTEKPIAEEEPIPETRETEETVVREAEEPVVQLIDQPINESKPKRQPKKGSDEQKPTLF